MTNNKINKWLHNYKNVNLIFLILLALSIYGSFSAESRFYQIEAAIFGLVFFSFLIRWKFIFAWIEKFINLFNKEDVEKFINQGKKVIISLYIHALIVLIIKIFSGQIALLTFSIGSILIAAYLFYALITLFMGINSFANKGYIPESVQPQNNFISSDNKTNISSKMPSTGLIEEIDPPLLSDFFRPDQPAGFIPFFRLFDMLYLKNDDKMQEKWFNFIAYCTAGNRGSIKTLYRKYVDKVIEKQEELLDIISLTPNKNQNNKPEYYTISEKLVNLIIEYHVKINHKKREEYILFFNLCLNIQDSNNDLSDVNFYFDLSSRSSLKNKLQKLIP